MDTNASTRIDVSEIRRLLPLLGVDSPRRRAAFDALLAMGPKAIRPILEEAADGTHLDFRGAGTHPIDFFDHLGFLLVDFGEAGVEPLIDAIQHGPSGTHAQAARTLGNLKDTRAIQPLMDLLDRSDSASTRRAAAASLASFNDPRAREALARHPDDVTS